MMLAIILVIIAILVWYYLLKPLNYWSSKGVKQTKPYILFGDSLPTALRRIHQIEFLESIYNLYPDERYVGFYMFTKPVLLVRDLDLIKRLGVKDFDSFTDHVPFLDPDADPLWSKALLSLKGERWKEMRNVVSPTFTSSKIKSIYSLMTETAEEFVNYFKMKDEKMIEVEMKDALTRFTNDIIATTAFGLKVDSLKNPQNTFYEMGKRLTNTNGILTMIKFLCSTHMPKLSKHLGFTFLDPDAAKYFYGVIDDTIRVREEQGIVRSDMINVLLEARKNNMAENGKFKRQVNISNADIASQAAVFFFGGFDTVSTAICFGSYELALNKNIQDQLREEIQEYAKDGKVGYECLQEMVYMDMVVSEILRKWPPFSFISRLCTKPYTIEPATENEKPVHLEKNNEIWFPIYALQRNAKYFPDPEKFDPDRFSEVNRKNMEPYSYIPFGLGPRICIGNRFALVEIKALLFKLLLNFEIVTTNKTPIPLVLEKDIFPNVKGGMWLGLKPLN